MKSKEEYARWHRRHDAMCKEYGKKTDRVLLFLLGVVYMPFVYFIGPLVLIPLAFLHHWVFEGAIIEFTPEDVPVMVRMGAIWVICGIIGVGGKIWSDRRLDALKETHNTNRERIEDDLEPLPY